MKHICNYGCNKEARFLMTSGKWCCENHWNKCSGKRKKDSEKKKSQIPWNKGLKGLKGTPHTEETKKILSNHAKNRGLGGYNKGSGRGKRGWFKDYWCDSSYELAFVIYCLDKNIKICRNTETFSYIHKGQECKYIPDFKRIDRENYFIEIKGWFNEREVDKVKYFPHKLKIYSGRGMKKILNYVRDKYGSNFLYLYDNLERLDV